MYGATIGKVGILTFPATTNQACCACSELFQTEKLYLFNFLISERKKFISRAVGGAQPNISKEKIVKTPFPLPPLEEQQEIVRVLDEVLENENKVKELLELEERIDILEKSILHKAFKGELGTQNSSDESAMELLKEIL